MTVSISNPVESITYQIYTSTGSPAKEFKPLGALYNITLSGFADRPDAKQFFNALIAFIDKWNVDHP